MGLQHIKLITFDVTNTLLKFRVPPWQYYAAVARKYGYKGTDEEVDDRLSHNYNILLSKYPNFGKCTISWEEWWRQVVKRTFDGHLPVSSDVNSVATELIEDYKTAKCWSAAEGSDILLDSIQKRGITVGIISNFDPRLYDVLGSIGIINKFDFIVTCYEFGFSKPDAKIFRHALERCKQSVKPSEALHIGDDVKTDYEGARLAGWHAVLISDDIKTEKPPAPNHVFDSLTSLYLALEKQTLVL
ncbi:rhythmically expressed gene 2 protein-like [Galleria mellonella]|uniref:Rhythmically expressed gene 2 protein-like n=1 Tax=Galleria mellonella TaxID=7137 RepID=A0A6J1X2F2_GALME|nr:rhythmically expressed gene 2 protein-like [Galleria mellonella]